MEFFNLYRHHFVRIAVATPRVRVADPAYNAAQAIAALREADHRGVMLTLFPELSLSAYTCDDLFQQQALLDACLRSLEDLLAASRELSTIAVIGLPLAIDAMLFNCAAVVHHGRLRGVVPKTFLPNYREFYEARQFMPGDCTPRTEIDLAGQTQVPFGAALLFQAAGQPLFKFHVEICEDLWVPIPPSRTICIDAAMPSERRLLLERPYERFPYVPAALAQRDERCSEIFAIQVQGLVTRLRATGIDKVVIGVSGGLDSAQALLVCARAMDVMSLPRGHIIACMMPGFASSERTSAQARRPIDALGCHGLTIDIQAACRTMLADIGHPFSRGEPVYDATFENVQAGQRTSYLFRLANLHGALVVGTSDLSELALGWCTYGVGDHMAHYDVNASVPKTLIQHMLRWSARSGAFGDALRVVLHDVLETTISPELVPGDASAVPAQRSEDIVGPFELQDFNLYYLLRFGYRPSKVAFLAWSAWHDASIGPWPDVSGTQHTEYPIAAIKRWLRVFVQRFFQDTQFKRSCLPNAPKVGSGGSLSPRGDYRTPSDAKADVWLDDLREVPDHDPAERRTPPS